MRSCENRRTLIEVLARRERKRNRRMDTNWLSSAVTDWAMSDHAQMRSQQRGIRAAVIGLILEEHDASISCGDKCRSIYVTRVRLRELREVGISPQIIDRADGVTLVIHEESRMVVTALHQSGRAGRHYRRGCTRRRGGRRSEGRSRQPSSGRRG